MGDCLREKLRVLARENGMEAVEASRRRRGNTAAIWEGGRGAVLLGRASGGRNIQRRG